MCERIPGESPCLRVKLPAELESEFACRARSTAKWCFGNAERRLKDFAYVGQGWERGATAPVAERVPNAWGIRDMHRNVFEWCWDWYDTGAHGKPPSAEAFDDDGPGGFLRVLRDECEMKACLR